MAWEASQNRHQPGAACEILSRSRPGSDSIITLIRWLSLKTEVTTARAQIAGASTPSSEYAGKAEVGPGGRKELIEGNIGDWKSLKKMEIKEREKDEAVASRAKAKTRRVTGTRKSVDSAVSASGVAQETRSASLGFLLHSENSLTEMEATILALNTP